jgi:hypothetical protein
VCHLCMNVLYDSTHREQCAREAIYFLEKAIANPANNRRIRAGEFIAERDLSLHALTN